MILDNYYYYFPAALSESVCDAIMEQGLEKMYLAKQKFGKDSIEATTGDWRQKPVTSQTEKAVSLAADTLETISNQGSSLEDIYVRDSNVSWLDDDWIYKALWPFIQEANKNAGWNFDWDFTENIQFTKYGVGQFYGWHADTGPKAYEEFDPSVHKVKLDKNGEPALSADGSLVAEAHEATTDPKMIGKMRKLSVTVSLSDPKDYDGGNLNFDLGPHRPDRYHECTEIRPRGSIIVFPSYIYHQVTPVTRGTRYSLVAWNLGYPFK